MDFAVSAFPSWLGYAFFLIRNVFVVLDKVSGIELLTVFAEAFRICLHIFNIILLLVVKEYDFVFHLLHQPVHTLNFPFHLRFI